MENLVATQRKQFTLPIGCHFTLWKSDLFLDKSIWKHLMRQFLKNSIAGPTLQNILKRSHLGLLPQQTQVPAKTAVCRLWRQLPLQTDPLLRARLCTLRGWTSPVWGRFPFQVLQPGSYFVTANSEILFFSFQAYKGTHKAKIASPWAQPCAEH